MVHTDRATSSISHDANGSTSSTPYSGSSTNSAAIRREEAEIDYRRARSRGGGKYVALWLLGQVT